MQVCHTVFMLRKHNLRFAPQRRRFMHGMSSVSAENALSVNHTSVNGRHSTWLNFTPGPVWAIDGPCMSSESHFSSMYVYVLTFLVALKWNNTGASCVLLAPSARACAAGHLLYRVGCREAEATALSRCQYGCCGCSRGERLFRLSPKRHILDFSSMFLHKQASSNHPIETESTICH